ncbi:MAG: hypothetical protein HQL76_17165 [Magnetococcales bacterium]|nr:hypothetical protein [Magnetococcales bacterium]
MALYLCGGGSAAAAEAKEPSHLQVNEFAADVVRRNDREGKGLVRGKMYVGTSGVRTEGERMGQPVWMIFKPLDKKVWTLFPQRKVYTEADEMVIGRPPMPDEPESPCRKDPRFVCRDSGMHGVNGRQTRLWEIALKNAKGGLDPYARMWVDVSLKLAIRESYADGLEVLLENVVQGVQPASLFEIPDGFTKVSIDKPVGGAGKSD